ncbi:MAG: cellulase family glycosylhydrolase [bacterium]|nr:cellulase family glycosylhydrolase [bacterium]
MELILLAFIASWLGSGCGQKNPGLFWTDGQWMRDAQGRVFISRGLNLSDDNKFPSPITGEFIPGWFHEDCFSEIASWGFNTVRFVLTWEGLEPEPGQYDERYLERLEQAAEWARAAGIYLIFDMHQDIYARKFYGDGAPEWAILDEGLYYLPLGDGVSPDLWYLNYTTPAVEKAFDNFFENKNGIQDHFIETWRRVAERFSGNPAVVGYDLINEPFPGSRLIQLDDFDREYFQPFYERLISSMFQVDSDHLFFFEPNAMRTNFLAGSGFPSGFSQISAGQGKLVFAPHFYDPEVTVSLDYDGEISRLERNMDLLDREALRLQVPIWVGEWGVWGGAVLHGDKFLADQLTVYDRSFASYSFWDYNRNPADYASPVNSTWMLDILIRPQPSYIAGVPMALHYDVETGKFELKFKEEKPGLASEILVPTRFCRPGDCRVEMEPDRSYSWEAGKSQGVNILKILSNSKGTEYIIRISKN